MPTAVWPVWVLSHRSCSAVSSVCVGWPQLPLGVEMRPCPHRSTGGSALPAGVHTCMWTQEKHINTEWTMWEYYESRVCLKLFWNAIQVYTLRATHYSPIHPSLFSHSPLTLLPLTPPHTPYSSPIPKFYIFLMGWDRGWVMAFPLVYLLFWGVEYDRPSLNPFCFSEKIFCFL